MDFQKKNIFLQTMTRPFTRHITWPPFLLILFRGLMHGVRGWKQRTIFLCQNIRRLYWTINTELFSNEHPVYIYVVYWFLLLPRNWFHFLCISKKFKDFFLCYSRFGINFVIGICQCFTIIFFSIFFKLNLTKG